MRRTNACWVFSSLLRLSSFLLAAGFFALLLAPTGKSRTRPILERTIKSSPKSLLMVFALAGDSTITKDLPLGWSFAVAGLFLVAVFAISDDTIISKLK